jgi:hypothetical protein
MAIKNRYDTTSTKRQTAHLDRLQANKGKRLPVDLDGDHLAMLDALLEAGYATSSAGAIRKAIDAEYQKLMKRKEKKS